MQTIYGKEVRDTKGMVAINLGSGFDVRNDMDGIDINDHGQKHFGVDFEKDRLPYADQTVDFIFSHHCLEHLWDVRNILNECHRVLKTSGEFEVYVPYGLWSGSAKPVHHQLITESWFDFLRSGSTSEYGYLRWDIVKMERVNKTGFPEGAEIHVIMKKYVE